MLAGNVGRAANRVSEIDGPQLKLCKILVQLDKWLSPYESFDNSITMMPQLLIHMKLCAKKRRPMHFPYKNGFIKSSFNAM